MVETLSAAFGREQLGFPCVVVVVVLLLQPGARDGLLEVAGWAALAERDACFVECVPNGADAATCQLGDLMFP
ncbi:hypothetical protein ABTY53_24515 [Streptomyces noursei]|uniref:hypothetical protein n=1 Tax=Streptomyces noursei TaxID=1971 RepID=UPI00332DA2D6